MISVNETNIWNGQNLAKNPRTKKKVDEKGNEGVEEKAVAERFDNVAEDGF